MKILIAEDDEKLNAIICRYLTKAGHQAVGFVDSTRAADAFSEDSYDMLITDVMMPSIDGYELAQMVREENPLIPIMFVTALDDFESKKRGFRIGIDDYMVKPVDMDELVLRVGALARRLQLQNQRELCIGSVRLVKDEMMVYIKDEPADILPKEFNVLYKLLSHPKKIFTRSELLDEFWGVSSDTGLRTVDVYITKLRKKFADCPEFDIVTVHGFGYKAIINQ